MSTELSALLEQLEPRTVLRLHPYLAGDLLHLEEDCAETGQPRQLLTTEEFVLEHRDHQECLCASFSPTVRDLFSALVLLRPLPERLGPLLTALDQRGRALERVRHVLVNDPVLGHLLERLRVARLKIKEQEPSRRLAATRDALLRRPHLLLDSPHATPALLAHEGPGLLEWSVLRADGPGPRPEERRSSQPVTPVMREELDALLSRVSTDIASAPIIHLVLALNDGFSPGRPDHSGLAGELETLAQPFWLPLETLETSSFTIPSVCGGLASQESLALLSSSWVSVQAPDPSDLDRVLSTLLVLLRDGSQLEDAIPAAAALESSSAS